MAEQERSRSWGWALALMLVLLLAVTAYSVAGTSPQDAGTWREREDGPEEPRRRVGAPGPPTITASGTPPSGAAERDPPSAAAPTSAPPLLDGGSRAVRGLEVPRALFPESYPRPDPPANDGERLQRMTLLREVFSVFLADLRRQAERAEEASATAALQDLRRRIATVDASLVDLQGEIDAVAARVGEVEESPPAAAPEAETSPSD